MNSAVTFYAVWVLASGYCPCELCCGSNACGLTATGEPATGLIVAVDPRCIPLRSIVELPGYGAAVAKDTGRLIKRWRVDVFYSTHEQAKQLKPKWVQVRVWHPDAWALEQRYRALVKARPATPAPKGATE